MQNVKIKEMVRYKGHSVSANGGVKLNFTAMYSELTKSIQVLQMLNNDVKILAKLPDKKPISLGVFRIKNVIVDGDGESTLKFDTLNDFVEMDNINAIIGPDEFQILMEAKIDMEDEENE